MKKVSGVYRAKGFGEFPFEFYVDDSMTNKQIENEIYNRTGMSIDWTIEDGYEAYTVIKYRKKRLAL